MVGSSAQNGPWACSDSHQTPLPARPTAQVQLAFRPATSRAPPLRAREGRRRPGTEAGRLWWPRSAQAWGGESRARRWPRHVEAGSRLSSEASPVSTCERRRNSWGPDLLRRGRRPELQGQWVGSAAEQKGARGTCTTSPAGAASRGPLAWTVVGTEGGGASRHGQGRRSTSAGRLGHPTPPAPA